MENEPSENSGYERYVKLGGIINQEDYNSALSRLEIAETNDEPLDEKQTSYVQKLLKYADIELGSGDRAYRIVKLYSILRADTRPEKVKYHHDQMSDQQILVEALRILDDENAVSSMIAKYTNILFNYGKGGDK